MLNRVTLMGRLTKDVELRQTQSGIAVAKFTIAVEKKFADKQTGERECDFIDCQAWSGTADFIARYFAKGSMIAVEGSLQNNNWTDKDGNKRYSYIVQVDQAHFCGGKSDNANGGDSTGAENAQIQATDKTDIEKFAEAVNAEIVPDNEVPF